MEKKKIEEEKEKKGKKKWLLLLLLLLLFMFVSIGITYSVNEVFRDSIDETIINTFKIDTPTAPVIGGSSGKWSKKEVVKIEKDAKSYNGIAYYEYCMLDSKDFSKCEWKKTETKNMVASTTGKYYVVFRGVSKKGKAGKNSNIEEVYIDNEGPTVSKLEITNLKSNKVEVYVEAKDNHSGIGSYYYKLDNGEYQKVEKTFNIENLEEKEYTITIKVEDKLGNYKEVSKVFTYKQEVTSEEKPTPTTSPEPTNTPTPSETPELTKPPVTSEIRDPMPPEEPTPDEEDIIPEINLDKVPLEFTYGEKYELPSYVDFKGETGSVSCIVEGEEYTDTSTLKIGKHLIVCNATTSKNVRVMVEKEVTVVMQKGEDEVFDGWIRLNLYFPENSIDWKWRLGKEEEIRTGYKDDGWQDYTGPILVRLSDVENIYIKYKVNGIEHIIPPKGRVLVDIEPNKYTLNTNEKTKVNIVYDSKATTKEYRINGGEWQKYEGEFEVGVNTLIEAQAKYSENVYTEDGEFAYKVQRTGTDSVFISEYLYTPDNPGGPGGPTTPGNPGDPVDPGNPDGPIIECGIGGCYTAPKDPKPSTYLAGPIITVSPTELTESVEVTVTPQQRAEKIYIKIGDGKYQEYTNAVTVTSNVMISAYYIRESDGKVSAKSYYYVDNIKVPSLPYVKISANPGTYLTEEIEEVEVTISGSDYETLEYSYDGVIYQTYAEPLKVRESKKVYARGTNANGQTVEELTIITKTPPVVKDNYDVSIYVAPDKNEVEGLINEVEVSVDYDTRATRRYYKLGYYGSWQEYTGTFSLRENTTIYAYCTSETGEGETEKSVNNLTLGIASPIINASTKQATQQVKVDIEYASQADIKRYQIGNGPMLDYNGAFYVYENTVITAYNKDLLGNEATSRYTIRNIEKEPDYRLIDKGDYFIIKLNYPEGTESNEYKWKTSGVWKSYDEKGILLIKAEYKDRVLNDEIDGVKVKDENNREIIFTDNYYVLDVPMSEISENLYMRWDTRKPNKPTIVFDPEEATRKLEATILYESSIVEKYYKVVTPDGRDTGWKEYTGPIKVDQNNTVIYAKGTTMLEVKSDVANRKVTNIDEIAPEINVRGDFTTPKRVVNITVNASDDLGVYLVKWAKGNRKVEYFEEKGQSIPNNSSFKVEENGEYTIYAEDKVGNSIVKVIEVTNIDKTAPDLAIEVLTKELNNKVEVAIDYGDSKTKQYKIGTNGTYKNYTDTVVIKAEDVLSLANEDKTITIYAKGTDEAGNEQEISEVIYQLDVDAPKAPIINASAGYPILTEYGVKFDDVLNVVYDDRDDITNYISLDNGATWKVYTGVEHVRSGTVKAKSVKKISGLTVESSKKVTQPGDALGANAYDGDENTGYSFKANNQKKVKVDSSMIGKYVESYIYIAAFQPTYIKFVDSYGNTLSNYQLSSADASSTDKFVRVKYVVPNNTSFIIYYSTMWAYGDSIVREVVPYNIPTISIKQEYPILTEYGVEAGYNKATIKYFQTSVQKLYRINGGEWKEYQDKAIRLEIGDKIETKGIDKYGKETKISSYTSILPTDALGPAAYDDNESTGYSFKANNQKKVKVDSSMIGKYVESYIYIASFQPTFIKFVDSSGTTLSNYQLSSEDASSTSKFVRVKYVIPNNTNFIIYYSTKDYRGDSIVHEIVPYTTPIISIKQNYPMLTEYGVDAGYNKATIKYFQTSVQKLYRINGGEWKEYQDKAIRLEIGDKIEAKGIDKYGKETKISSYTSILPTDALGPKAYDGNKSTVENMSGTIKRIDVSPEMQNRKLSLTVNGSAYSSPTTIKFYNASNSVLKSQSLGGWGGWSGTNAPFDIPVGTKYIKFHSNVEMGKINLYEVSPHNMPTIIQNNIYPNLSLETFNNLRYQVKINYLSSLPQKLYSLDNGKTWQEYIEPFYTASGTVVKAKTIDENGVESSITTYTVTALTDAIDSKTFDNNQETVYTLAKDTSKSFTVTSDTVGRKLRIYLTNTPATNSSIKVYDKSNKELGTYSLTSQVTVLELPENSYKVTVSAGKSALNISEINLRPVIEKTNIQSPIITISDVNWNTSKGIEITYPEGYTNEYSLDLGNTWNTYTTEFTITEATTILARSKDSNGKVVSSSSYKVTKIDTTEPTITLDIPDEITVGDDYSLPTSYVVDDSKSSGSAICKIDENEISNTSTLDLGTYEITCTVTTGAGKSNSVSKTITVRDVPVDITLDIPDRILVGENHTLPTSVTGGNGICKIGEQEINNTSSLEVGTYDILCTVTSEHGTTKNVSKQVEVYEEETTEENNVESGVTENETTNE